MEAFNDIMGAVNGVIWHNIVLYVVLGVGVIFTFWSGFCQFRSLTHGVAVTRGKFDNPDDPGAINHFQALSAALSATVGLGNIAGVGVAVALGGPGAVFWMWMVGIFGMALKTTEVSLSMLYRNTDDPDNPHGGPMFVAAKAFKERGFGTAGKLIGGLFVVTLLISTITGGNMFQAWSVGEITNNYFGVPSIVCGIVLAVLVGLVIVGGIKRIGAVAGRIVPLMCAIYLVAAIIVLLMNFGEIPAMLKLIVVEAFSPSEASGAFLGGTAGYALLWGMKRALFSSEAGQGSSPIAHSAAKTDEPIREGVVAGLEPFIDTIVVCTLTALVILTTGAFNRGPETTFEASGAVAIVALDEDGDGQQDTNAKGVPLWTIDAPSLLPPRIQAARDISGPWSGGEDVFMVVHADDNPNTGLDLHRLGGSVSLNEDGESEVTWGSIAAASMPRFADVDGEPFNGSVYVEYPGPSLTGYAFDTAIPGLGKYLVTLAAWLFALSTMISWSYYGEQGVVFLFGQRLVLPYKLIYCILIIVATCGIIKTDAELDNLTALGTGVMLWANIPIMLIFGSIAMRAYHSYMGKLKRGEFHSHSAPSVEDVVSGRDVEND
ncbi:MAG: alanine/glycine:cation symporter family protein [Planctomycetota bacterium]|jgi:AGCS family alanine or glycine:cation symporter